MLVNLLYEKSFSTKCLTVILFISLGLVNVSIIHCTPYNLLALYFIVLSLFFLGYVENYVDQKHDFISSTLFPVFFYSICLMPFIGGLLDYKTAGSLLLLTYAIVELIYFEIEKKQKESAFDIGVFIGVATIVTPSLIFLSGSVLVYFFTLKTVNPKIFSLSILGFILPILVTFQISILIDYDEFLINYYKEKLHFNFPSFETKQTLLIPICVIVFLAFVNDVSNSTKIKRQLKKVLFFAYITFMSTAITYFLYGQYGNGYLAFAALSIMIILSTYFKSIHIRYIWFKEFLLWVIILCLFCYHFYDYIITLIYLVPRVTF